ncbi:alpha-taxilin-like isoform X1 [Carex littledalei]|uniref:Alpha-taxilin-like isoform X1 n=1 Tax=Carex littledalei TaxID=544730 RepID=A0A833RA07_9POAL|nr:alpha-taxilin-like isoform X1 [Carex littledalei]
MEASPANRLPEADSLPDGFVDSSAEPASSQLSDQGQDCSISLDLDRPEETTKSAAASSADETLDPEILAQSLQQLNTSDNSVNESNNVNLQGGEKELHIDETKEISAAAAEAAECLRNLKDNNEPKRKATKRGAKSEKELLELTWMYQKAIAERDSAIAMRERLESLCRELQRQNKMLMGECKRVSTEGQNMRQELSERFNNAIKDVSIKLDEQKEECISQLKENELLRSKLKHLADQYTISEQQFANKLKEKMLELELADLKIQQHQEKSAQEKTQLQLYADQISQLTATEKSLRLQLTTDQEKFQQFQEALTKSNEIFETYKQEMEKMVKMIKDLKKDNEFLRSKCEKSDIAIVKLIEEREAMKKQLDKMKNQKEKLESLCRSLQAERKCANTAPVSDSAKES